MINPSTIILALLAAYPLCRLTGRLGLPPLLGLSFLLPGPNLVLLCILAFAQWPSELLAQETTAANAQQSRSRVLDCFLIPPIAIVVGNLLAGNLAGGGMPLMLVAFPLPIIAFLFCAATTWQLRILVHHYPTLQRRILYGTFVVVTVGSVFMCPVI